MKFGIAFANTGPFAGGSGAAMLGRAAEAAGFDSVWTVEHVVYPEGYESTYPYAPDGKMPGTSDNPIPDPMVWLSYVAACTTELTLATGIVLLPERHPITYAKEVATLDNLSGGRAPRHRDRLAQGRVRSARCALERRGLRTEEYVAVMRALWAEDNASFDGEFVSFTDDLEPQVDQRQCADHDWWAQSSGRRTRWPDRRRILPQPRVTWPNWSTS